ncbi:bifunctional phosphoribosylaminoimidazolecarboxamide formyltransferase/IMP cyclohydrolase [Vulgatibacter incomptus]|uniref:Bifunctional purine biosynthesis protein PurH n=1 Tax=Vulgatibacter incomptus TaxID=1391653 RepID=A0A0K1PCG1_9BACT|nr:bifunctional phosphoribosylaminoimidazolecarboxamide formyltransferase/IMP cyclohydrolase [Vulgatibacter incomptus]AKU91111.1 IMP cyclohydrolase [Vulgatibacter incomptus]
MAGSRRALLSVSDKSNLVPFAKGLSSLGFELISTGGTAKALKDAGLPVIPVAEVTGAPEILGGRVKTLHPKIHGGILARLELESDRAELEAQGITPIELVVVNLYPFRETVAKGAPFAACVEEIDIGGPAMIRASAKNSAHVGVVVDPSDYDGVLGELQDEGKLSPNTRRSLMRKAFAHTAAYDAAISEYLGGLPAEEDAPAPAFSSFVGAIGVGGRVLRYGENPHQGGAFYRVEPAPKEPSIAWAEVLGGKELSYNNLLDLESALACVKEFDEPACVIIKHNNPCGVATAADPAEAFDRAREIDPVSAFGGIVALNRPVDRKAAEALKAIFLECVIAPSYDDEARAVLAEKKNLRLLADPLLGQPRSSWIRSGKELRSMVGGLLVQDRDLGEVSEAGLKLVTKRAPTADEVRAALFAWKVCKHVKSNAIVFGAPDRMLTAGAGQTSRVDSVKIARMKSRFPLQGSSVASDAFFPFRDGLDEIADAGATCVIQPGGSVKDAEIIAAADERGISMLLTGMRHFRH